jgi:hypothetical protein
MFFSKSTMGFYDPVLSGDNMPKDAVRISPETHRNIIKAQSAGKVIAVGNDGLPIAIDRPTPSVASLLERAKDELRALREPMLSAVTGIGWEASESGDDALVQEARNIRNALRDITDDPTLNAAQTHEEMRAAGVEAYRRIAAGASHAFAATFKEFTGA